MARPERFELPTLWFEARCSIQLSYERVPPSYQNSRAERRTAGFQLRRKERALTARSTKLGCRVERCRSAGRRRRNQRQQRKIWWAWVDLNYRPHPYQGCALAT